MSYLKRKKERNRLPPFVAILKEMLVSEAWAEIGNASRVAYIHLKAKCFKNNQEEIWLSFKEMEKFMTHQTFSNAVDDLIRIGFITKEQFGGLYRKRNVYKLSEDWKKFIHQVRKSPCGQDDNHTVQDKNDKTMG